jgi:hypothetical protein
MKVKFKNLLMGYTGKTDDSVIYFSPKRSRYIIRKPPTFHEGEHHRAFAQIQKQIFGLEPSAEYRQDLRDYLRLYNELPGYKERPVLAWNLMYVKMLWNMHYIMGVDLSTINRSLALELPCRCVSDAVEAGMLPRVKGYQGFTALI